MPVAEERQLATELEVRLGVQQVEAGGGGGGQYVLADAMQEDSFEQLLAVLLEAWNVELHDSTRPTVWRCEGFIAARPDVAVNGRFALAEDAA